MTSAEPSHIRPATRGDLPEILDLLIACDVALTGAPDTDASDVQSDWNMAGFDLARDTWVAEGARGAVCGYAYTGDQLRSGELEADVWVHPDLGDAELSARLLALAERRARDLAAERAYPAASLDVFCIGVDHAKREMLRRRGYELRRTVYRMATDLTGDVRALAAPDGIEIRRFRAAQDAAVVHDTMDDAFTDHFRQSEEPFDAWRRRLMEHPAFDPDLWFVAWHGDEPVGALLCFDHGDLAWVQGVGVRGAWRRRGLGTALLTRAFAALAARGQLRVELGVDAEGATQPLRLYERAGMHVTYTYELYARDLAEG
jgi:mycothiol synthase